MGYFDKILQPKVEVKENQENEEPKTENTPVVQSESVEQFNALKNSSTKEVVTAMKNAKVMELFDSDETIHNQITESAKQEITDTLDCQKTETKNDKADKKFKGNKEACKIFGVEDTVPLWQQKAMTFGAAFWFCVYFVVALFTIAPISTFALKLNTIFKKMWVSIVLGVVVYILVIAVLPILLAILK